MRSLRTVVPALLLLGLVGCQSGPELAGDWVVKPAVSSPLPMPMEVTATFTKPDKMEMRVVMRGTADLAAAGLGENASVNVVSNGTYKVADGRLTTKTSDVTVTDEGVTGLAKAQIDTQKETIKSQLNQGDITDAEMVWEGNDSFTVTTPQGTATFTRK